VSQLNWYQWKASRLERLLARFAAAYPTDKGRLLEIGSGPIGIVGSLQAGEHFAVDPLEDFYRQSSTLTTVRRPGVVYLKGTGEDLPFANKFFSLVIVDNVIDHTYSPKKILQEVHRVLAADGLLYLAVNIHMRWGAAIHILLARLCIDRGHPYSFTASSIQELLFRNKFEILGEELEDYEQSRKTDCNSPSTKDKLKGCTGLSEFLYHTICRKISDDTFKAPRRSARS